MEEKRPQQRPAAERDPVPQDVTLQAAPRPRAPGKDDRERDLIRQAWKRADADRETMRASGHGDHKGEDGF